jgi:acetyl esterase
VISCDGATCRREVFYIHGGGLVVFDVDDYSTLMQELASQAGCSVTAFEYPKAPESGIENIIASLAGDIIERARQLPRDTRVVLAGDSMGAYLAMCMALKVKPWRFERIVLINPVLDLVGQRPSYLKYGVGLPLSAAAMSWFRELCLLRDGTEPVRLFQLEPRAFDVIPSIHIHSAEFDVLRDEAFDWAAYLSSSGISVVHRHYWNLAHDFCLYAGKVPEAHQAVKAIARMMFAAHE